MTCPSDEQSSAQLAAAQAEAERLREDNTWLMKFVDEIASGFETHPEHDGMDDGEAWREAMRYALLIQHELRTDTQPGGE